MRQLILHPRCPAGSVHAVEAFVEPTMHGCRATFVARGNIAKINVPIVQADRGRFDDLWRTTCFEIFWQPEYGSAYREFNLSPSQRWACYDFDDVRQGMRNAEAEVLIDVSVTSDTLQLTATIRSALPTPAQVALNAIIEDADGTNRFWALAFADGPPEFHSERCRQLAIQGQSG